MSYLTTSSRSPVEYPAGQLSLPLAWPGGLPAGFELTFQAWLGDPAAPAGLAASNALVGISR